MIHNLTKETFTHYFTNAPYHYIPPTIRRCKLFIIAGFNLKKTINFL